MKARPHSSRSAILTSQRFVDHGGWRCRSGKPVRNGCGPVSLVKADMTCHCALAHSGLGLSFGFVGKIVRKEASALAY